MYQLLEADLYLVVLHLVCYCHCTIIWYTTKMSFSVLR